MAKYKVKVIALLLKRNVIAEGGDIVDENQLTTDAKSLIDQGFIEEVQEEKVIELIEVQEDEQIEEVQEEKVKKGQNKK
jgi:Flp pilus assembly secretin CpaC